MKGRVLTSYQHFINQFQHFGLLYFTGHDRIQRIYHSGTQRPIFALEA
jgi:hypothetical protein